MTRSEYDRLVDGIVAAERERLSESLNTVFDREGHSREALAHLLAQMVESQPASAARVVSAILDKIGLLPSDLGSADAAP